MNRADELIGDYVKRLERELRDLPRARRREIVDEISAHIAEATSAPQEPSETEVLNLLDRLGDPTEIAADARARFDLEPKKAGATEIWALIMLSIGSVVFPIFGWIVGVALLWSAGVWTRAEKLIGTLVVPGGLGLPAFLLVVAPGSIRECETVNGSESCSGGWSTLGEVAWFALVAIEVASLVYLAMRMRRRSAAARPLGDVGVTA
jgi:hypothetical protein